MGTRIYVGKLAYEATEDQLQKLFSEHGTVTSVAVITDRETGQSKGFAFVEMEKDDEAQAAIKALDGTELSGRNIMVNIARPKEDRGDRR
jgi:RNA recognition motif-containing protein